MNARDAMFLLTQASTAVNPGWFNSLDTEVSFDITVNCDGSDGIDAASREFQQELDRVEAVVPDGWVLQHRDGFNCESGLGQNFRLCQK